MPEEILNLIPADIVKLFLVVGFSLIIGLEQRRHHINDEFESRFGTDRTFTLIGILGYILYVIDPKNITPFLSGGAAIAILLSIYYLLKIKIQKLFGITSLLIALITYCLAPLVYTQPYWLTLLIVILILVITEIKETLFNFSKKFDENEFITFSKFMLLVGVILPLLPDKPISDEINISPYKFWLAIVAVSGISYSSYLLKKFVFQKSGILLTGILGGLYSSTATTIILARKSNELHERNKAASAIFLATAMMYLRMFLLAMFFNKNIALKLAPSFAILISVSVLLAGFFFKFQRAANEREEDKQVISSQKNPLELKTAVIFAGLFIFFAIITAFVEKKYGAGGINILSFVVGVTDIDPFIINLFQTKSNMENVFLVTVVLNASSSNNLLKMIYGITLSDKSLRWKLISGFSILIIVGLTMSFIFRL